MRKRLRQTDVSDRARVSRTMVGRIERGQLDSVPLGSLRRVAAALDARLDTIVRWHGGDLGRLVNARHSAMHEVVARMFGSMDSWIVEPEVSFSIYGERGVIDLLGWHEEGRTLLVIELKTEFAEINELMGTLDRKGRLAADVARDRGWLPLVISTWVLVAESRSSRRALAAHRTVLRAKFPLDGRGMRRWLRQPAGSVNALSFLSSVQQVRLGRDLRPIRRVARPRRRIAERDPST